MWILLSDALLGKLSLVGALPVAWGVGKGLFFVAVTTALLYLALRDILGKAVLARTEAEKLRHQLEFALAASQGAAWQYEVPRGSPRLDDGVLRLSLQLQALLGGDARSFEEWFEHVHPGDRAWGRERAQSAMIGGAEELDLHSATQAAPTAWSCFAVGGIRAGVCGKASFSEPDTRHWRVSGTGASTRSRSTRASRAILVTPALSRWSRACSRSVVPLAPRIFCAYIFGPRSGSARELAERHHWRRPHAERRPHAVQDGGAVANIFRRIRGTHGPTTPWVRQREKQVRDRLRAVSRDPARVAPRASRMRHCGRISRTWSIACGVSRARSAACLR